ncbi:hypothetical protein BGX34_009067 [Mortierella sp. NVP85]|nr:hypothetical protein BGX34_009067 [Mortierella sp. NVP85]
MAHAHQQQLQTKAPTLEDIEQKYSQLPPQYRQAVFEKQQREYQQGLLHQQQPSAQTRSGPPRNVSTSLSSSPTRELGGGGGGGTFSRVASSAWSATRQRIASAPLTTVYRKDRDSDSSSITSGTTGPGRTHWKVPLDHALDFNPAEGVLSRACIGCYDDYEEWQNHTPSSRSNRSDAPTQNSTDRGIGSTTTPSSGSGSSAFNHKPNVGRIPDGFLGGDPTLESIGREDPVTHTEHVKTAKELDKFLQERPQPEELVEKNILKDPRVSPELQQRAEELKKVQIEDVLISKLDHRPPVSELMQHNILHEIHVAPSLQKQADALKRSQLEDKLIHKIDHRPAPEDLIAKNILHESNVAPGIQKQTEDLKRTMAESSLKTKLLHRPTQEQLVERHIL